MRHLLHSAVCVLLLLPACSTGTAEGAAKGATSGAILGAAGSAMIAAVFGGDVAGSAARGAVGGATVGAISGAATGAAREQQEGERQARTELEHQNRDLARRNRELELEKKLRAEVGPDNTEGLSDLVQCRHAEALAHARRAAQSGDASFRLAALWLEAMIALDRRHVEDARAVYPKLVDQDPKIATVADAERKSLDLVAAIEDTRAEFDLPRRCQ